MRAPHADPMGRRINHGVIGIQSNSYRALECLRPMVQLLASLPFFTLRWLALVCCSNAEAASLLLASAESAVKHLFTRDPLPFHPRHRLDDRTGDHFAPRPWLYASRLLTHRLRTA